MNPIIDIPIDAREDIEQLGSKPKFWVLLDNKRWLFKEVRPNTGEDWAEKAAAELAQAIGIKAATVELAEYSGRRGCISLNFVNVEAGEALVHGNEILAMRVTGYDKGKKFRQSDHTLENIDAAIRGLFSVDQANDMLTELAGYMVLDVLIGNTDRHHENWGLLLRLPNTQGQATLSVAPSFDHASSLGRELLDSSRREKLSGNRVASYVGKARGGMFRSSTQRHGENPLNFAKVAARAYPAFFKPSLARIASLAAEDVHRIFDELPSDRATIEAKSFAKAMVFYAQKSLIEI